MASSNQLLVTLLFISIFCLLTSFACSHAIVSSQSSILDNHDQSQSSDLDRGPYSSFIEPDLARWANTAYQHIKNLTCDSIFFMTRPNCHKIQSTSASSMAVYFAKPTSAGKYSAATPHGEKLRHSSRHDAVIAFDPFPEKRSTHLVLVFFVDFGLEQQACEIKSGHYMGNGQCLALALKRGCYSLMNQFPGMRRKYGRRCETKYLPRVHLDNGDNENRLTCAERLLVGSSPCVQEDNATSNRRPVRGEESDEQDGDDCDPLKTNFYRCLRNRVSTQSKVLDI